MKLSSERSKRESNHAGALARGGMRVGEVLSLTPDDVNEQKLTIRNPKSGKDVEISFIPRKVAERLRRYIAEKGIKSGQRIFRSPMLQQG